MGILLVIAGFFISTNSYAAGPVITAVSGASKVILGTSGSGTTGGTTTVFAGLAGDSCAAVGNGSTCNNCTAAVMATSTTCTTAPLCACNTARPYDTGTVTITATAPSGVTTGTLKMVKDALTTPIIPVTNSLGSVTFNWTELCTQSGATSCATAVTATISGKIFVDKDSDNALGTGEETTAIQIRIIKPTDATYDVYGTRTEGIGGIQGFVPYPGDEKIYLEDLESHTNFPAMSYGAKVTAIRVMHSSAGMETANLDASDPKDLTLNTEGKPNSNVVDSGLSNDTTYVFRVAMVDEANNVVQFFPAATTNANCDSTNPGFNGCPWAATPEKVLGLLTEDINCFVATAAYGTALEPKLITFRDFRYKVLLRHPWGKAFVSWYYKYGPMLARFIYDKPILRTMARGALWPLYLFSAYSLKLGFFPTLALSLMFLTAGTCITWFGMRRVFVRT